MADLKLLPTLAEERCETSDLPRSQCAHCRGHRDTLRDEILTERAELLKRPGWFRAQYPGTCDRCSEPFGRGWAIKVEQGFGSGRRYRAECCAEGDA